MKVITIANRKGAWPRPLEALNGNHTKPDQQQTAGGSLDHQRKGRGRGAGGTPVWMPARPVCDGTTTASRTARRSARLAKSKSERVP